MRFWKQKILLVIVLGVLLLCLVYLTTPVNLSMATGDNSSINTTNNDGMKKYSQFLSAHTNDIVKNYRKVFTLSDYESTPEAVVPMSESHGYGDSVIKLANNEAYTFNLDVDETGLYAIYFDYYITTTSTLSVEAEMVVNNEIQYYEQQQLVFDSLWEMETIEFELDRYGNEIVPASNRIDAWNYKQNAKDGSSLTTSVMLIYLEQDIVNKVNIRLKTGSLLFGKITLESPKELNTYSEYLTKYADLNYDGDVITKLALYYESKSSLSTRSYSSTDPSFARYKTSDKLLNAIYPDSWDLGNQSISWELNAPSTGFYTLSFKYTQYGLVDMPVFRSIAIDGEIPYLELQNYQFYYNKKWVNETLHDGDTELKIYLEEGIHTLTMSIVMDAYKYIIEEIDRIMDEMNEMALDIKFLTNGQTDEYRDWKISSYLPNLESELLRWSNELEKLAEYGNSYSQNKKGSSEFSNLKSSVKKLRKLAEDPDQVPNNMNLFTEGTSSVSQLLGDTMLKLNYSPLGLEKIFLGASNPELPKPRANFFKRTWEGIKRFFLSFFSQEYSIKKTDDETLEIWVARSRQYIEIMQQMADAAGLKVQFSLMPAENKLILANASGDLPDVAMGVNNWIPYDLALRGITVDLRQFDGYEDLVSNFTKGSLIPYAYEEGLYGVPETQDFWVTFYRTDIFNSLGITVPNTWEELLDTLPILQRLGYNFYSPISAYRGLKPFVATLPIFYQYGGSLYSEDGMSTTLSGAENIEALKLITDLFVIYDVPEEVPSFYNSFRYGTLPIGIANAASYTQVLIAAPEIVGNWSIAPHIGVYDEELDDIVRYSCAGSQGLMIFSSSKKQQQAFDFINWWMGTDTQSTFIQMLSSMYGNEYLWWTANLEAFKTLPIASEDKEIILEQWSNWAVEASRVPATYMVERSISDAFSKVVFSGANVRIALDEAVIDSNREIKRKMIEFEYMDKDGNKIKDYIIPTIFNIDSWLSKHQEESDE